MNTRKRNSAFTLVEMVVVICLIGILTAIVVPNLLQARESGKVRAIISSCRQLDIAKAQYVLDNPNTANSYEPTQEELLKYLNGNFFPKVGDEVYTLMEITNVVIATYEGNTFNQFGKIEEEP